MGVYAANRLASIAEDTEFSQEILEAFADESRETSHITSYGIVAQLHENDSRMFDAIIGADFASLSTSRLLEAADQEESQKKMNKATSDSIWKKIEHAIKAIGEAILKVARAFRDKIYDLIKADKKIVDKYGAAIAKADSIDVTVKFALPTKSIAELAKKANSTYAELARDAGDINTILRGLDDNTEGSGDGANNVKAKMNKEVEDLIKSVSEYTNGQDNSKITKAIAQEAVAELKTGKAVINAVKKNADAALKVVKAVERAAKSAKSKHADSPAAGARVYAAVSGTGASVSKAMGTVNTALAKILGANRKIVLAAGRAALGAKVQNEAVLGALFDSSDLYVAEMCEMV